MKIYEVVEGKQVGKLVTHTIYAPVKDGKLLKFNQTMCNFLENCIRVTSLADVTLFVIQTIHTTHTTTTTTTIYSIFILLIV